MELRYYPELREAIAEYFSEEELREFLYEMAINYDHLRGATIRGKAQSLVDHCEKRGLIEELLTALAAARPHVDWKEKARPRETKVSAALLRTTQKAEFKKFTDELSKECGDMINSMDDSKNNVPTRLYLCFENWETVHHNLRYIQQDLNTPLVEDVGALKDSRALLKILIQYCDSLLRLLDQEEIDPPGIRPSAYLRHDLKKIKSTSDDLYAALYLLEGSLYAQAPDEEKIETVRQELITLEVMVADIVEWFIAVIGIFDSDKNSAQAGVADNR